MKLNTKTVYGERLNLDLATPLKILTPKQMLQRLPLALAQAKAGNTKFTKWKQTNYIFFVLSKRND